MDHLKVLVLYKDRTHSDEVERILCEVGFDVEIASNEDEAMRILGGGEIGVVVCAPESEEEAISLKAIRTFDPDIAIVPWRFRPTVEVSGDTRKVLSGVLKSSVDRRELVEAVEESLKRSRMISDEKRTIEVVLAANRRLAAEMSSLESLHRRLRREQNRMIQTAKEGAIEEMVGAVNHELNQPLCVIMGKSELLLKTMDVEDPGYRMIKSIWESSERMAELVRKIGNFKQYKTKPYVGKQQIVDLDRASVSVG